MLEARDINRGVREEQDFCAPNAIFVVRMLVFGYHNEPLLAGRRRSATPESPRDLRE